MSKRMEWMEIGPTGTASQPVESNWKHPKWRHPENYTRKQSNSSTKAEELPEPVHDGLERCEEVIEGGLRGSLRVGYSYLC
jgi:hypothetical protein